MVDLGPIAAMGVSAVVARAPRLAQAMVRVRRAVERRRPHAALLVGFSEITRGSRRSSANAASRCSGMRRRRSGVARGRARPLARTATRWPSTLPSRRACWRRAAAAWSTWDTPRRSRPFTPELGDAPARVVLLRPAGAQVRAHLVPFLGAARHLARFGYATELVLAEGLEPSTAAWAEENAAVAV